MKTDLPSTKVCVQCKKEFSRRDRESNMKWKFRIYCSAPCVYQFQREFAEANRKRAAEGKALLDISEERDKLRAADCSLKQEKARAAAERDLSERIERAVLETEQRGESQRAAPVGPVDTFWGGPEHV